MLGFFDLDDQSSKARLLELRAALQERVESEASHDTKLQFDQLIDDCLTKVYRLKKLVAKKEKAGLPHLDLKTPSTMSPKIEKARALFKDKQFKEALELYEEYFSLESPKTEDLVSMGTAALYSGDIVAADKYANRAIVSSPNDFRALMLKGAIFFGEGAYIRALPYFMKAKKIQPDHPVLNRYCNLTEQNLSMESSAPKTAKNRRWKRRQVKGNLVVSDYSSMQSVSVQLKSLSAGGALVEAHDLPDEFNYSLEIPGQSRINGLARKIYHSGDGKFGVRFIDLSPEDEDLIDAIVS